MLINFKKRKEKERKGFFSLFFLLGMLLTLIWQIHKECDTFGVTRLCYDIKTHFCTQTVKACIYMQRMKRIWMLLLLLRKCAIATMSEETMSQTKKKWVKTKNLWSKSWRKQRFSSREPFYKVDECNRFKLYLHGWREKEGQDSPCVRAISHNKKVSLTKNIYIPSGLKQWY